MVSTFTPNINLEEPARGDDVGTWDTPVNGNMSLVDLVAGGIASITLNNSPIVLSAAQYKSNNITFISTLTGAVAITFPTSFIKPYTIGNLCTGSSAFVITLGTTASGGQQIACPPGEFIDVFTDGTNVKFRNLDRVGTYWDYAGSSVPAWVSGCTVPPYLNCNAGTFSSATYPQLTALLGGTTLPDSRGRARFALDQSVGRLSSAIAGFSPNTVGSGGGDQSLQSHNHGVTDPGHFHTTGTPAYSANQWNPGGGAASACDGATAGFVSDIKTTGITINNGGAGGSQNIPPAYIGGLTMIRAA